MPTLEIVPMSLIRTALSLTLACLAACTAATSQNSATGDPQAITECDSSGTWAIKASTPVTWNGSFVLANGTGNVTNWLKTTRTQSGSQISDVAQVCGVDIPDYKSTAMFGNELYGLHFPDALFDPPPGAAPLPTFTLTGTLSSNGAGMTYTSGPVATVLGATMANPATDPWPTNGAALTAVMGPDGKPSVAADVVTGNGHSDLPLNPSRSVRANRVYTTFRSSLTSKGDVKSCDRIEGTGTVAVINNKPALDSHVLGCRHDDGSDCTAAEFRLLDGAAPVYKPSGDTVITMVRVPATATCADIRAMTFAQ
jgi:hypothetical protein